MTDSPEALSEIVSSGWTLKTATALDDDDRRLWEALSVDSSLYVKALRPDDPWARVVIIGDAAGSQFEALQEALGEGLRLCGSTACLALSGEGFRGQRGRRWAVGPGNLFLTVAFSPELPLSRIAPGIIALPAISVVDAIEDEAGVATGIKWVNDIWWEGKKIGGVLTATQCTGDLVDHLILGIGVNIDTVPEIRSTAFVPEAGCLAELGVTLPRLFWATLHHLAEWYEVLCAEGSRPLVSAYRHASAVVGREVEIWDPAQDEPRGDPLCRGVVTAVEDDLALRIDGRRVVDGRLAFVTEET